MTMQQIAANIFHELIYILTATQHRQFTLIIMLGTSKRRTAIVLILIHVLSFIRSCKFSSSVL